MLDSLVTGTEWGLLACVLTEEGALCNTKDFLQGQHRRSMAGRLVLIVHLDYDGGQEGNVGRVMLDGGDSSNTQMGAEKH